jgi:hypothetical protein
MEKQHKTKVIRKLGKEERKRRALNKLRTNGDTKILNRRLRGKTLNLAKLGLIKPKKSDPELGLSQSKVHVHVKPIEIKKPKRDVSNDS